MDVSDLTEERAKEILDVIASRLGFGPAECVIQRNRFGEYETRFVSKDGFEFYPAIMAPVLNNGLEWTAQWLDGGNFHGCVQMILDNSGNEIRVVGVDKGSFVCPSCLEELLVMADMERRQQTTKKDAQKLV